MSDEETKIWSGCPSQWLNVGPFVLAFLVTGAIVAGAVLWAEPLIAIAAVIPVSIAVWRWLVIKTTKIEVSTERITTTSGVFSRQRGDMELYRVKDTTLHEPFLLRLVKRANVRVESSDRTTPSMVIPAIQNAEALRQQIRTHVERLRLQRGVREMDMDHPH